MKKQTNWHFLSTTAVLLITAAFIGVTWFFTGDVLINLIFVGLMFLIVLLNYIFFLRKTRTLNNDFSKAVLKIKDHSQKDNALDLFLSEKELFNSEAAASAFDEYRKEVYRIYTKERASVMPDIRDYINDGIVDAVIRTEITDQVSGAMTGLGILGTFVGLTIGLNKFSLGSDIDTVEMQASISGLLEGIKTAFMTSIFGVIYSLVFNFFYKRIYIQSCECVNEFVTCFENELAASPQNDFLTAFVRNQESQTESLSKFAENIAGSLAKQMNEVLRPTMEYFNLSVDKFLEKSVYTHNESLEAIVNAFIDNMNDSMGNQFAELGKTVAELNSCQIDNNQKLREVVDSICENAADISKINSSLEKSICDMSEFIDKLNNYEKNIDEANANLLERVDIISGYNDRQSKILSDMLTLQKESNKIAEKIDLTLEKANNIFSDHLEKSEELYDEQSKEFADSLTKIIESANQQLLESANTSEKIITESFENVKAVIDGISSISGEQSRDLIESAKSVSEESRAAIESCRKAMEEQAKATGNAITDIIKSAAKAVEKLNTTSEDQNRLITETFANAVDESRRILDLQMKKANEISEKMSVNMTKSASALDKAYKELENDISKVLRTTFDSFDSGMADISSHLSGTIKSNEQSIEKLNKYMDEMPIKLYAIIEKMMSELTSVIDELSQKQIEITGSTEQNNN